MAQKTRAARTDAPFNFGTGLTESLGQGSAAYDGGAQFLRRRMRLLNSPPKYEAQRNVSKINSVYEFYFAFNPVYADSFFIVAI